MLINGICTEPESVQENETHEILLDFQAVH